MSDENLIGKDETFLDEFYKSDLSVADDETLNAYLKRIEKIAEIKTLNTKLLDVMDKQFDHLINFSGKESSSPTDKGQNAAFSNDNPAINLIERICYRITFDMHYMLSQDKGAIADRCYHLTEKLLTAQSADKQPQVLSAAALDCFYNIVRNNPENKAVAKKIADLMSKTKVNPNGYCNGYSPNHQAVNIIREILRNHRTDKDIAAASVVALARQDKLKAGSNEDDYIHDKEYMGGRFQECLYKDYPAQNVYNVRYYVVMVAEENIKDKNIVEKCITACEHFGLVYSSIIYGKLAEAGYRENNFLDRYAEKLNNGEIIVHNSSYAAIKDVAAKLNTDVLKSAAVQAGNKIYFAESEARQWHHKPYLKDVDYVNKTELKKLVDKRLADETIEAAKAQKNPPAIIFVDEYAGERYGAWAERAYIQNEKGNYLPTNIVDELYYGNEDSSARDQIKRQGKLLAVEHGVYARESEADKFKLLERNPDFNYRVLGETAYWRDVKQDKPRWFGSEGYEGSTLVSKNPVTGKFEDIEFAVDYCHGDYLQSSKQKEDGTIRTTIYKRNEADGKFVADAEFPAGAYLGCYNKDGVYSISFETAEGDYTYMSNANGSSLAKKAEGEDYVFVDKFTNQPYENKPHRQRPMADIKERLTKKKDDYLSQKKVRQSPVQKHQPVGGRGSR